MSWSVLGLVNCLFVCVRMFVCAWVLFVRFLSCSGYIRLLGCLDLCRRLRFMFRLRFKFGEGGGTTPKIKHFFYILSYNTTRKESIPGNEERGPPCTLMRLRLRLRLRASCVRLSSTKKSLSQ